MAAILKIDISPYLSEKSSDLHEILYTAADFELDERHVIRNEKVALDRLRVRQNVFLVLNVCWGQRYIREYHHHHHRRRAWIINIIILMSTRLLSLGYMVNVQWRDVLCNHRMQQIKNPSCVLFVCQLYALQRLTPIQKSWVCRWPCEAKTDKKLSCRRETARRFVSLNILPSHSRSFEMTRRWNYFDDMFGRFDRIPACDRRADRQTSCHSIVRAMHTRRAVKKQQNTETEKDCRL